MCHRALLISFWPRGSCFYMLNRLLEQGSHSLLRFRKYYFGFWELRISKNMKKLAFIRTYRPWFDKWLARYVFIFFIFSFFMQILNSQWNNRVNFFFPFTFFSFSLFLIFFLFFFFSLFFKVDNRLGCTWKSRLGLSHFSLFFSFSLFHTKVWVMPFSLFLFFFSLSFSS